MFSELTTSERINLTDKMDSAYLKLRNMARTAGHDAGDYYLNLASEIFEIELDLL